MNDKKPPAPLKSEQPPAEPIDSEAELAFAAEIDEELSSDRPESLFASEFDSEDELAEADELFDDDFGPSAAAAAEEGPKEGFMRWDEALTLEGQVEAILFASPKPLSVGEIAELLEVEDGPSHTAAVIEATVASLVKLYRERNGGFRLEHDKGIGYQFRTVPAAAPLMERMFASRQRPLSRAALETLAIIAYRQPVTRADVEYIRGVDAGSIIKNLLDRELIACTGRKDDAGRPMMFGTTAEFLKVFRLQALSELPPLSAFQPAPELMADAMARIDQHLEEVDVDAFMADPEQEIPNVSEGVGLQLVADDFADAEPAFQVRDPGTKPSPSAVTTERHGARFDAEGIEDDDRRDQDQDPKVAFSAGDSLASGSGEDADGGEDRD